ncbi:hypothetical protein HK100_007724 [Physocladia obscura]|uniref:Uncharacterized protein n=1 Tax=Physocladia obscura TaxID=109957 RepID=A0AAD5SQG5_9FUNG|nr:hypothetical protein HK100_007724 [Physocladia obscura]
MNPDTKKILEDITQGAELPTDLELFYLEHHARIKVYSDRLRQQEAHDAAVKEMRAVLDAEKKRDITNYGSNSSAPASANAFNAEKTAE